MIKFAGSWTGRVIVIVLLALFTVHDSFSQHSPQQWRDSVSVLLEAIRLHPGNTDLRLKKAEANINLGQWQYAIEEYGNVLRMDSRNLAALYFRAFCHTQMQQYHLAKNDYEAFLAIQPQHLEAHLGLAHTLQKMGRRAETLDELNRTVQMFPDSADAYAARATYETDQQLYDIALYDWDEAIRLRPQNTDLIVSKVDVLLHLGRRKEAREVLDAAVASGTPRGLLKRWYDQCR